MHGWQSLWPQITVQARVSWDSKGTYEVDVVVHACNPNIWKVEAGGSRVQGQLGLHSETLSLNKQENKKVYIVFSGKVYNMEKFPRLVILW
jgi:cytochrome b involved in lipid metabolism